MKLNTLQKELERHSEQTKKLCKQFMPVWAGKTAVSHFKQNFHDSGFTDNGFHQWQKSKRQLSGGKDAGSAYKTLTSGSDHLMSSIKYITSEGEVTVFNNLKYADIHNEGGIINSHPAVTKKMRGMAWAKYYEALGIKRGQKIPKEMTIPEDAAKWKGLALTKKTKLDIKINMPKRQFIGESHELLKKIYNKLDEKLKEIYNP
jgi:phage gpG-like protein